MANINHEEARARRQRQYEIDRITARYEADYHAGKAPRLEDYLQQYPEFARELKEFFFYFHSIAIDLPEPDAVPAAGLSPAAEYVLDLISDAISAAELSSAATVEAAIMQPPLEPDKELLLTSLVKSGLAAGYPPSKLAEALGISRDVLAKLEAHAIAASSIPRAFIQRTADILRIAPEAVLAYFRGASPTQSGAFFYADKAPKQEQESFLEAVQASPRLTTDQKRTWAEIVAQDLPDA